MKIRTTTYDDVDRHGEAAGVGILRLPFHEFWPEIESRFAQIVVRQLCHGRMPENPDRFLEKAALGAEALSLREWFFDCEPPKIELESDCIVGLRNLARLVEDLARDDGEWLEDAKQLDQPAEQAILDLQNRLQSVKEKVVAGHGLQAARQLLERARERLLQLSGSTTSQQPAWTIERTSELERLRRQLEALANPPSPLKRVLLKVRPQTTLRLVLPEDERNLVEHQILPAVRQAARLRFENQRQERFTRVVEAILGRPGKPGLLDQVLVELGRDIKFFQCITPSSIGGGGPYRSTALHEISVADSLATVIDQRTGRRLADLYSRAIKRSGGRPRELADRIREQGLTIRGRRYPLSTWTEYLKPAEVRQALRREVASYLGSANRDAAININEPRTAFEHAASITPLHPELRPRLTSLIPIMVRRSLPYADVQPIVGAAPQVHAFLYCYPPDRHEWESLFRSQVTIVNSKGTTGVTEAYATGHPYVAVLVQHALAVPLGGLKSLPVSASHGSVLRRTKAHEPVIDRNDYPEIRLLAHRPSDYADSEKLFAGGSKAKLIHHVPGTNSPKRYAMANLSASLDSVFSPDVLDPELVSDESFHAALHDRAFRDFIRFTFPQAADFHQVAMRLAREHNSAAVADELVKLGIIVPGAPAHYRLNVSTLKDRNQIPEDLFHRRCGPLLGLSKEEFISTLHRSDTLYNVLFWRVVDSVDMGWLSPNDVSAFVLRFAA